MTWWTGRLLGESARSARSSLLFSAIVAAIVGLAIVAVGQTAGKTEIAERNVVNQLNSPEFRVTTVTSDNEVKIQTAALTTYAARSDVTAVIAANSVTDFRPAYLNGGGQQLPTRDILIVGDADEFLKLPSNTMDGLYLPASTARGGSLGAWQSRDGRTVQAVATYDLPNNALPAITDSGVIRRSELPDEFATRTLYVIGERVQDAQVHRIDAPSLFGSGQNLSVESSAAFDAARTNIESTVQTYSRSLVLFIAGAASIIVAVIVTGWSIAQQRDLGRRRALGASRPALCAIIIGQTTIAAVFGAGVALAALNLLGAVDVGTPPSIDYQLATAWIMVITTTIATVLPTAAISLRDPVRVIRTA